MATGKLIITRGLPGCGKSTRALDYATRSENYDMTRIVTLDDIRAALDTRFAAGDEPIAQSVRDFTIRRFLEKGYTVISADTNLNESVVNRLYNIASSVQAQTGIEIEVVEWDMTDVPLEVCLERNRVRWENGDFKVPDQAIIKMYEQYLANR